ncbi:hypothetical protein MPTK1_3g18000 [Marchantia polymorpha subsp. ruderalis]|uniref:Secreted protein n=2 Tax=Marchantia polymorpha TaxID=3197 RepID=A0AAF6B220_MARPO|nr:hypothetical protein MARPO_0140s0041 [Marchantia polymorpha]BBN06054.1 hypothetical protein Mp_3g18000 [Marchantia polymorpha subsp. ruderalis]|eukprot:PTQ29513.1 hypothetical protein MARPO_0140s0041 [Marchantia polymorpha]
MAVWIQIAYLLLGGSVLRFQLARLCTSPCRKRRLSGCLSWPCLRKPVDVPHGVLQTTVQNWHSGMKQKEKNDRNSNFIIKSIVWTV